MNWKILLAVYLAAVNLAGFAIMGIDKRRAVRHAWRVSEASLFFTALIGGSLGSIIGMYTFRHKTRHWYFVVGMPVISVLQILVLCMILLCY